MAEDDGYNTQDEEIIWYDDDEAPEYRTIGNLILIYKQMGSELCCLIISTKILKIFWKKFLRFAKDIGAKIMDQTMRLTVQ